jgi:hypothetical protein
MYNSVILTVIYDMEGSYQLRKNEMIKMSEWKLHKPTPDEEPGAIIEVAISSIQKKKAVEIFGDVAKNPERDFFVLLAKRGKKEISIGNISVPDDLTNVHPKSNAGKFLATYGKAPRAGMKVKVQVDADGFWRLLL